jgi:hypothetical protein
MRNLQADGAPKSVQVGHDALIQSVEAVALLFGEDS